MAQRTAEVKVTVSDLDTVKRLFREAAEMIEAAQSLAVKLAKVIEGDGFNLTAIVADYPALEREVLIDAGLIAGGADPTGGEGR